MPAPRITWDWRDEDDPDSHPVRRGMDRTKERQPRTMIHGCRDRPWSAGGALHVDLEADGQCHAHAHVPAVHLRRPEAHALRGPHGQLVEPGVR